MNIKMLLDKGIKVRSSSDLPKITLTLKKNDKLAYTSDLGLVMALGDAQKNEDTIFILKKSLQRNPIDSEFSPMR